jgi:hypothetical protein
MVIVTSWEEGSMSKMEFLDFAYWLAPELCAVPAEDLIGVFALNSDQPSRKIQESMSSKPRVQCR